MGNERYKKIIDKQSKIYDRDRVKHYFIKTSDNFLRIIPEGKSILDAGCGTGLYTIKFIKNGRPAIGVDFSKEMVDISKKMLNKQELSAILFYAILKEEYL